MPWNHAAFQASLTEATRDQVLGAGREIHRPLPPQNPFYPPALAGVGDVRILVHIKFLFVTNLDKGHTTVHIFGPRSFGTHLVFKTFLNQYNSVHSLDFFW